MLNEVNNENPMTVNPAPQDLQHSTNTALQQAGVKDVNRDRELYEKTQEALKGTGVSHYDPAAPHDIAKGDLNERQFEESITKPPSIRRDVRGFANYHFIKRLMEKKLFERRNNKEVKEEAQNAA